MANLQELVQFDAGVYQLETSDPVQGGVNGISNAQAKSLANRTAWLKKHVDDLDSGATVPLGIAQLDSPLFTGTPKAPTPAAGDNSKLIATTEFVQRSVNGMLSKSVAGAANVTLTAGEVDNAILVLSGALTGNIAVIVPAVSGTWIVANRTTGAFSLTVKTAAGTGVAVSQGKNLELFCDGVNVIASISDFNNVDLTGNPTAPTPTSGDNDTSVATTAFVWNAIDGVSTVNMAGGASVNLSTAQSGSGIVRLTGAITANINAVLPTQSGQWIISNETTGAFSVTAKHATGTGVVVPQGLATVVYSDGTNVSTANSTQANAPTPAQFDNDTSVATTEFVQRALGSMAGFSIAYNNLSATTTLPASVIGKAMAIGGTSAQTVNLPSTAGLPDGASLSMYNQNPIGGASYTIAANGTQSIVVTAAFANTTTLAPGDMLTLTVTAGNWAMTSGASGVSLARMAAFASSKVNAGYQKLPSGLILQWGTCTGGSTTGASFDVFFPIAFPNAGLHAFMTPTGSIATSGSDFSVGNVTTVSFNALSAFQAGARNFRFFALGF